MACCLFGAKPLSKPMLVYYQLYSFDCRLQFASDFVSVSTPVLTFGSWMGIFYGYSNRVLSYTIILFIVETDSELALSSFWSHCNLQMKAMDTRFPKEVAEKKTRGYLSKHYCDVIMGAMASQITSLTIVYSIVHSGVDPRKHQSSASLAFVGEFIGDRWILRTNGQ